MTKNKPLIYSFLDIRHSTRNLSDKEFEILAPQLAKELVNVDYKFQYSDDELLKDWNRLLEENINGNFINSTSRAGLKLCEHFFPNFWDVENRGKTFSKLWKDSEVLEKVLRWNRKSHSTPYLSELRRGVYFTQGLTKSTMYRPLIAKSVTREYRASTVLDPCAGWGGRMLGVVAAGAHYYAFEPNKETHYNLLRLAKFLNILDKVTIICDDFLELKKYNIPKVDLILTSPPYFDLEIYDNDPKQSVAQFPTYKEWVRGFIIPAVDFGLNQLNDGGVSCWNVAKIRSRHDLREEIINCHKYRDFILDKEFSVVSSRRQSIQNSKKNKKSSDDTMCFTRKII